MMNQGPELSSPGTVQYSLRTISEVHGKVKRGISEGGVSLGGHFAIAREARIRCAVRVEFLMSAEAASLLPPDRVMEVVMTDHDETVALFIARFRKALAECPIVTKEFYNSFEYTTTGNNLSHPRTLGFLVQACHSLPGVAAVDVDVRLNEGGAKFQPDIVGRDKKDVPILIVDFESPNSSDARLPRKDVEAYAKWTDSTQFVAPYLIITSLPSRLDPPRPPVLQRSGRPLGAQRTWELRYTSPSGCNYEHREFADLIRGNPFAYWYKEYRNELKKLRTEYPRLKDLPLYFANLDGLEFELVDV